MSDTVRFGVSLSLSLLDNFDRLLKNLGYSNRSEAVRDLIRQKLVEQAWGEPEASTFAVVSLVYDHHAGSLAARLTRMQHNAVAQIIGSLHIHVDAENCLEIIVMKGQSKDLRALAEKLVSLKGVKHGTISRGTTGKELS
jgi:CopG family nickel-responsive transcriptional regulator